MLGYAYITATKGLLYFSNGSYYHLSVVDSVFFCVLGTMVFGTTTLMFATGTIIAILLILISDRIAALWLGIIKPGIKKVDRINSIGKGMIVALVAFGIAVFVYGQLPEKTESEGVDNYTVDFTCKSNCGYICIIHCGYRRFLGL